MRCRFCETKFKRDYRSCPCCLAHQARPPHVSRPLAWVWLLNLLLTGVLIGIWVGYWLTAA